MRFQINEKWHLQQPKNVRKYSYSFIFSTNHTSIDQIPILRHQISNFEFVIRTSLKCFYDHHFTNFDLTKSLTQYVKMALFCKACEFITFYQLITGHPSFSSVNTYCKTSKETCPRIRPTFVDPLVVYWSWH